MAVKTRAEVLHVRAFIEGVEVPVMSATVSSGLQTAATAMLQLIATDAALRIRPRSIVEIYYKNSSEVRDLSKVKSIPLYKYISSEIDRGVAKSEVTGTVGYYQPLASQKVSVLEAQDFLGYDLMFLGEVAGYSFYEDSSSRSINMICLDFSNHLDAISQYTYDVSSPESMSGMARMQLIAGYSDGDLGKAILRTDGNDKYGHPVTADIRTEDIDGKPKSVYLDSIVGGVIGLDQRLGKLLGDLGLSLGIKAIFNSVADAYIFYRDVDEELNLRDQIFIAEDPISAKIYVQAQYLEYIFGYQNRYGSMNSLKNLIKIVFKLTHFEFSPLPGAPFYLPKDFDRVLKLARSETTPNTALNTDSVKSADAKMKAKVSALKQTLMKPETVFAEPPACNIIFPDEMFNINVGRQYLSEPTRGIDSTDHVAASQLFNSNVGEITNLYSISPAVVVNKQGDMVSYTNQAMLDLVNNVSESLVAFGNTLLDEEVLKGIMPVHTFTSHILRSAYMSRLSKNAGDAGTYAIKTTEDIRNLSEEDLKNYQALESKDKRFYIQEASYKFIYARFQNRTATVSCKFLPRIVPGFTALACEKAPFRTLSVDPNADSKYFGYLGHVSQVTHVMSQAGAVTSLTMTHVKPTNEYLDMFTATGVKTGIPDYREIGTAPWATDIYGPTVIHKKYIEWLGGMHWTGDEIDSEQAAVDKGYLGILPLTRAVALSGMLQSKEAQAYFQPGTRLDVNSVPQDLTADQNLAYHFLDVLRELMIAYNRDVTQQPGQNANVEKFSQKLVTRPMANRVQVLGYLNAYFSEVKNLTDKSKSTRATAYKAYQRYLVANNYYGIAGEKNSALQIDGIILPNGATSKALKEFQKAESLLVTGALDEATIARIDMLVASSAAPSEEKHQHTLDTENTNKSVAGYRKLRRKVRLTGATEYVESLQSLGGGLRG